MLDAEVGVKNALPAPQTLLAGDRREAVAGPYHVGPAANRRGCGRKREDRGEDGAQPDRTGQVTMQESTRACQKILHGIGGHCKAGTGNAHPSKALPRSAWATPFASTGGPLCGGRDAL